MPKNETTKAKILVLDDEQEIVDVFSLLMRQFDYDADFFRDAATAIETMAQNPMRYDLVITDIKMPKMDGISFAEKIREFRPDIPIIFMTGYPSEELKKDVFRLGKVAFLEKPFHLEKTFQELIPKLLKDSSAFQQDR